MIFTSVEYLTIEEMLKDCHVKMDADNAVGIDDITKEEYARHLNVKFEKLVGSLKRKFYKTRPARWVKIPKDDGKARPKSSCCYEDKLV